MAIQGRRSRQNQHNVRINITAAALRDETSGRHLEGPWKRSSRGRRAFAVAAGRQVQVNRPARRPRHTARQEKSKGRTAHGTEKRRRGANGEKGERATRASDSGSAATWRVCREQRPRTVSSSPIKLESTGFHGRTRALSALQDGPELRLVSPLHGAVGREHQPSCVGFLRE